MIKIKTNSKDIGNRYINDSINNNKANKNINK